MTETRAAKIEGMAEARAQSLEEMVAECKARQEAILSMLTKLVQSQASTGSERSRSDSALKIQKVLCGFLARKSVKKILAMKRGVNEIEKWLMEKEVVELIQSNPKEKLQVKETLMNLLFDSLRGLDSRVSGCWNMVFKQVIDLLVKMDAIVSGKKAVDFIKYVPAEENDNSAGIVIPKNVENDSADFVDLEQQRDDDVENVASDPLEDDRIYSEEEVFKIYSEFIQLEYLEERILKDLGKEHSEFISYPISRGVEKTTENEISDDEDEEEKKEDEGKMDPGIPADFIVSSDILIFKILNYKSTRKKLCYGPQLCIFLDGGKHNGRAGKVFRNIMANTSAASRSTKSGSTSNSNSNLQGVPPPMQAQGHQYWGDANAGSNEVRSLWIGDLQQWMDENFIINCFSHTGEFVSAKVIRNLITGILGGYGFVEFVSNAAAEKILLSFNGTLRPNSEQSFRLNWATFGASERRQDDGPEFTVFIGDLATDVNDYTLQDTFKSVYPSVKGAKVVTDRTTGHSKGYGFVKFGDENEQMRAMTEMKSVRFQNLNSEKTTGELFFTDGGTNLEKIIIRDRSVSEKLQTGFESGANRFIRIKKSLRSSSFNKFVAKGLGSGNKFLDPQGPFLQQWNKIFVLSCLIAVSLDPLFFYVPVINDSEKCLWLDQRMEIIAIILRSFTDIFYVVHIIFQFHTGFIAPSSRVFGRGVLVEDSWEIAKRYLSSYFLIDILAVLPLPQVIILIVIPKLGGSRSLNTKNLLKFVVLFQYIPRILRIYPLYKEVTRTSGILTETAWAGAAFNLLLYMLASHVLGAFWYLVSIERETTCWQQACRNQTGCILDSLYCDWKSPQVNLFLNTSCPIQDPDKKKFDFGIFLDALQSGVVESMDFPQKFCYCFWWGLRNLSSLGQNLETSTYVWEIGFAVFISISGLVLFAFLIGNMQTYLQSTTTRLEEMRVKRRDAEQWMSHRLLPESLRERIRRYEQYKWQETRGVDEENLVRNLPKDLRRDIKRHLCLDLLMRVPMFEKMDEQLLDAMCDRLKPVLYTEDSYIVREGDPVDEMLFIMRGKLLTMTTNGGRTGFFNSEHLKAGDFCGEELLTWALDPHSSVNLPISTRTVQALVEVEAFALKADDLKFVASQFRRLHSKQLRHTFRLYSQQWRTWAACFIQAAWRRYSKKKLEESLREEENRLQDALAKTGGCSPSLGATIYASRFAANALRLIGRNSARKARVAERVPPMLLQKPAEPDFTGE